MKVVVNLKLLCAYEMIIIFFHPLTFFIGESVELSLTCIIMIIEQSLNSVSIMFGGCSIF